MKHSMKDKPGKYVDCFSWARDVSAFVREIVTEFPILNVCSGPVENFGDVRVDRYVKPIPPAVIADWTTLPFSRDSFAAVFADPPWNFGQMKSCADFCNEALRIAPALYLMAPWTWINRQCISRKFWVREFPGVNVPVLLGRYERTTAQPWLPLDQHRFRQYLPSLTIDAALEGK